MVAEQAPAHERLLHVATRLFTEHGFEGTSVSRIVREAGVTMPVLYYHFGSKSELLGAVVANRGNWIRGDVNIDPSDPPEGTFRRLVTHAMEQLEEVRDGLRLRLVLAFEAGPDADKFRDVVFQQRRRLIAHLEKLMAAACPKASSRRAAWLAEVYLAGVQSLALELIGTRAIDRCLPVKAENLVQILRMTAEMPEDQIPEIGSGEGDVG